MHVVVTNPCVWPWVRRGSERFLNDVTRYLKARGHRVTVYSMGPEDRTEDRDGITYVLFRQRWESSLRQLNSGHYFAIRLQRALRACDADVVYCLNYFDAFAAIRARRGRPRRYKVAFHFVGIPMRRQFRAVPLDAWFVRTALREADLLLVVSEFAREAMRREYGYEAAVMPPPVETGRFATGGGKLTSPVPAGPRLLFIGDVEERRKGAAALCRAFPAVRARHPDAELVFAGRVSPSTRQALIADEAVAAVADRIHFHGVGDVDDLPTLYRSAAVTVLPAVWEAFGMVLVESMAAGTPVVSARHGGVIDVVKGELVGRLFDPGRFDGQTENVAGLSEAIFEVLARGKTSEVSAACRARAECFSWEALGPEYERALLGAVSR